MTWLHLACAALSAAGGTTSTKMCIQTTSRRVKKYYLRNPYRSKDEKNFKLEGLRVRFSSRKLCWTALCRPQIVVNKK